MTPLQVIETYRGQAFSEGGDALELDYLPGLTPGEIAKIESELPCPMPGELRDLLGVCSGIEGGLLDWIRFSGDPSAFAMDEVFPNGRAIAGDGCGNFWIVDLLPSSTAWGPIYFACHDAPVILYQCDSLAVFVEESFRLCLPPNKGLLDDVSEDRIRQIWDTNPDLVESGAPGADPQIASFASELGAGWFISDLRAAKPGDGFSWGRFGPRTEVRRFGDLPIFAYRKPVAKKGFLAGLFGRG